MSCRNVYILCTHMFPDLHHCFDDRRVQTIQTLIQSSCCHALLSASDKISLHTPYLAHYTPTPDSKVHILHSTFYTPHSTLYTPHSTLHTLLSTFYTPHSTLHTPHSTLHILHSTLHTLLSTFYTPHSTLHTPHSTLHILHSTFYTPHSTLYSPHSTLHNPHSTLHTLHSTLHTPQSKRYTPHSTLYTAHSSFQRPHSTLSTVHSTLHTLHSTLYTLHSSLRNLHSALDTPQLQTRKCPKYCSTRRSFTKAAATQKDMLMMAHVCLQFAPAMQNEHGGLQSAVPTTKMQIIFWEPCNAIENITPVTQNDFWHIMKRVGMSRSATPATRNEVARHFKPTKVTTFAALPIGKAIGRTQFCNMRTLRYAREKPSAFTTTPSTQKTSKTSKWHRESWPRAAPPVGPKLLWHHPGCRRRHLLRPVLCTWPAPRPGVPVDHHSGNFQRPTASTRPDQGTHQKWG